MAVYQIPQKTLREDRIIGPLTVRDLLFICGTGIVAYFTFTELNRNPILLFTGSELGMIAIAVLVIGVTWTFIKIDEKPLEVWMIYLIHFLRVPKVSLWQKSEHEESIFADDVLIADNTSTSTTTVDPVQSTHEIGKRFDAISKLLDAPDGVITAKETEDVMGMLGEDDTIVAMKETIEKENKNRGVEEQQNESKARLESVIGDAIEDKKQPTIPQAQVFARPEGGIRGFLQQTSRLFVSNVLDAFQVHATNDNAKDSSQSTIDDTISVRPMTSKVTTSLAENSNPSQLAGEGMSSSPDQLLEELRSKSASSVGLQQQASQEQPQILEKSSERVKIVSDAALNE